MAQYEVCFSIDWIAHGLLNTYRPSQMTAFLIHSRLVVYQWVSRSTTRSYRVGWRRSNGSIVTRSVSKRTVSPSIGRARSRRSSTAS